MHQKRVWLYGEGGTFLGLALLGGEFFGKNVCIVGGSKGLVGPTIIVSQFVHLSVLRVRRLEGIKVSRLLFLT